MKMADLARFDLKDMEIHVIRKPNKKHLVLSVGFDGEKGLYDVANFKDEESALWFMELLKERIK